MASAPPTLSTLIVMVMTVSSSHSLWFVFRIEPPMMSSCLRHQKVQQADLIRWQRVIISTHYFFLDIGAVLVVFP